jgi:hypothetical protein
MNPAIITVEQAIELINFNLASMDSDDLAREVSRIVYSRVAVRDGSDVSLVFQNGKPVDAID